MSSAMEDRLNKLREERIAREKARIEKLRELNLKKYNKSESQANFNPIPSTSTNKLLKSTSTTQIKHVSKHIKNNFHVNGTTKRAVTIPASKKPIINDYHAKTKAITKELPKTSSIKSVNHVEIVKKYDIKSVNHVEIAKKCDIKLVNQVETANKSEVKSNLVNKLVSSLIGEKKATGTDNACLKVDKNLLITNRGDSKDNRKLPVISAVTDKNYQLKTKNNVIMTEKSVAGPTAKKVLTEIKISTDQKFVGKSLAPPKTTYEKPKFLSRKSTLPKLTENTKSESVFERLYKPKFTIKKIDNVQNQEYLKKAVKNNMKRHTVFENRHTAFENSHPPRRSISAVHFKRIGKNDIGHCIHKWASIGDKLDKPLENEDECITDDRIVSAVKSERKKVKFMNPMTHLNTPRPDELQARLKSWLEKRGKSIDSYHHLHCFGIHHLKSSIGTPSHLAYEDRPTFDDRASLEDPIAFDEENKENIALESDSDDGSYDDAMNNPKQTLSPRAKIDIVNWRNASFDSESVGFNDTVNFNETTITSADTVPNVDDLLLGALNDLTSLMREGYEWQQSAHWLRSLRARFPNAPHYAAYWECRAALEDSRGDLPASVQCWEEAIAKGTKHSVVEANLDQLLDKFMQLKISPKAGGTRRLDPKLLDVKNVFKSTVIRFAVQQAKLRQQSETPVYTVTPVRRSARLSHCPRTPLRRCEPTLCDSVRQVAALAPEHVFQPNEHLVTPP